MTALAKLTWVEVKLFAREPITVIFVFAFPLVVLVVIAGVFDNEPDPTFAAPCPPTTTSPATSRW